eukprot:gene562-610_t
MGINHNDAEKQFATRNISAYMFFMKDNRTKIQKEYNITKNGDVSKKVGELWNKMDEAEKEPYTKQAEADKLRYEKELSSGLPKKVNVSKVAKKEKQLKRERERKGEDVEYDPEDSDEAGGKKKKKKKDPNAPKKPANAYMQFLNHNRADIAAQGIKGVAEVAKEGSRRWREADAATKTKWETKWKAETEIYKANLEKYKATGSF